MPAHGVGNARVRRKSRFAGSESSAHAPWGQQRHRGGVTSRPRLGAQQTLQGAAVTTNTCDPRRAKFEIQNVHIPEIGHADVEVRNKFYVYIFFFELKSEVAKI